MAGEDRLLELAPPLVDWIRRAALALALATIVVGFLARERGWFDYRPGGAAFTGPVWAVFLTLFGIGALLAVRWELVGGIVSAFAAAALVAFATNQLEDRHALVVVLAFAVPGALWVVIDLVDQPRRQAAIGLVAAAAVVVAGYVVGQVVYDRIWGPTHPEATISPLPDSPVEWVWSGGVTSDRAVVRAKVPDHADTVRLAVSREADFADPTLVELSSVDGDLVGFDVEGLDPDTDYHYAVEVEGVLDRVRSGTFRTFSEGPASFRVAIGSCARVGSNGAVFEAIAATDPLLYLIVGDFHYGDIPDDDRERYDEVLDVTLTRPAQAALYRSTPVAYVWDDHDYGVNDADSTSKSRRAAMDAYRAHVPSYELAGADTPVHQAFSVGRVRFILTDARSARIPGESMLGPEQKVWFIQELVRSARDHALIVWVNPVPWVAEERAGADHWGGYAEERRQIADVIASNGIDNLVMVSGDAHMVAIDDGTNTDFSSDGSGPGFPLVHAAALDRPGGAKGGPYSHGAFPGSGQFATLDVIDDGNEITVTLAGHDWRGDELVSLTVGFAG